MLLLIGLMEAALHQMQPSNVPVGFNAHENTSALGTLYPEESFPITEWSVSLWVLTNSAGGDFVKEYHTMASLRRYETDFSFYNGISSYSLTTSENISGKWNFYQLGSTAAMSYAATTIRNGNQYFLSSAATLSLITSSYFGFFGFCGMQVITI